MRPKLTTFSLILLVCALTASQWSLVWCSGEERADELGADIDDTDDEPSVAGGQTAAQDADQAILYATPNIDNYYIYEHFDDDQDFRSRWVRSEASKADTDEFKYDGEWSLTQTTPSLKGLFGGQ